MSLHRSLYWLGLFSAAALLFVFVLLCTIGLLAESSMWRDLRLLRLRRADGESSTGKQSGRAAPTIHPGNTEGSPKVVIATDVRLPTSERALPRASPPGAGRSFRSDRHTVLASQKQSRFYRPVADAESAVESGNS